MALCVVRKTHPSSVDFGSRGGLDLVTKTSDPGVDNEKFFVASTVEDGLIPASCRFD